MYPSPPPPAAHLAAELVVELVGDVASELQVLLLVLAHRHQVGLKGGEPCMGVNQEGARGQAGQEAGREGEGRAGRVGGRRCRCGGVAEGVGGWVY